MQTIDPFNELKGNSELSKNGIHTLYMYTDITIYIDKAVDFIYGGLIKGDKVLLVENEEMMNKIQEGLRTAGLMENYSENLLAVKSEHFYIGGDDGNVSMAANKLDSLIRPFIDDGFSIRTWGKVAFTLNEPNMHKIRKYECECDEFISAENVVSVCCYNALETPSYLQNELLKTHTHIMTDEEFGVSSFYNQQNHKLLQENEIERLQKADKHYKHLEEANNRLLIKKNQAEFTNKALKESESNIRAIINKLPIPVIIRKGTDILFTNDTALEHLLTASSKEELDSFFEKYDRESGSPRKVQEHHFESKNAPPNYYLVNSINLLFNNQRSVLHSFVDMTQEKQNEMLMMHSERMNIAGQLAASIAHELRNPLTAVKGFFQLLKSSGGEKDFYYDVVDAELSRIEDITSELLSLAKPHPDRHTQHNIVQIVKDVILLLTSQSNMSNIEILLDSDEEEYSIFCDSNKIKQVFINLIKNAIEAMDNGGKITLSITAGGGKVNIKVTDQGKGILPELVARLGEPFYTTKEKGTGIGMMVCYQIIEGHGGTIHVSSKVGLGTTFTITLPNKSQVHK
ncbi:ATP-binding protein [Rossellomorea vietnamensis]|uniref:ATP-binding protein n=1 Tax=Rossellomorea vietnamensis TaxID=218284 RepID=UPI003CF6EB6C